MSVDDDDKPTVVLDLNALKKQKLKQEEDLANIVQELEFSVGTEETNAKITPQPAASDSKIPAPEISHAAETQKEFPVILFDFNSDTFQKARDQFPKNYQYHIAKTLPELNKFLVTKNFQIIVFNYDVNPKAVNSLTAQIKQKFPHIKTMILAKGISPEKAKIHAQTTSGAHGYSQFPIDTKKIEDEFIKIEKSVKKVS